MDGVVGVVVALQMAPTSKELNPDQIHAIEARLGGEELSRAIAKAVGVDKSTVNRTRVSFELFGIAYPPTYSKCGRLHPVTAAQKVSIVERRVTNYSMYSDEIALAVRGEFGVDASYKTILRVLAANRWSFKLVRTIPSQRSDLLQAD